MNLKLIKHILFYCGNFKKGENLLLIYDQSSEKIFIKFKKFLNNQNFDFNFKKTKNFNTHGKNLGKDIEKK